MKQDCVGAIAAQHIAPAPVPALAKGGPIHVVASNPGLPQRPEKRRMSLKAVGAAEMHHPMLVLAKAKHQVDQDVLGTALQKGLDYREDLHEAPAIAESARDSASASRKIAS